ncbi:MAG TPA: glycoside hydrolase family 27 protein [Candidatus Limnocylindrales bacterium]|nr:glycoside hydrolase family 27 protein [Candidatus Limnocylindrales bacterium]
MGLGVQSDGLAPTPPLGWNSWNRFGPFVSEQLVLETADAMVASGMRDAGYRYVVIDDAWHASVRDVNGDLTENRWAFPHGLRWLGERIHERGLLFGLYTDAGTRTCQGYPASLGNEMRDAKKFADFGVDFIKVDWCHTEGLRGRTTYPKWTEAVKAAGRPMVLSICEWARDKPWEWAGTLGHMWRTSSDIADRWDSVMAITEKQVELHPYAGPDHWNDPDMLEVGNGGMSDDEYRSHFSLWAMLAAPLMAGNDIRSMSAATREILTAPEVIAIDQDPLGRQARRVAHSDLRDVWSRPLADGAHAVLLLNRSDAPTTVEVEWKEIGIESRSARVRDVWERADFDDHEGSYRRPLAPHGCALLKVRFG